MWSQSFSIVYVILLQFPSIEKNITIIWKLLKSCFYKKIYIGNTNLSGSAATSKKWNETEIPVKVHYFFKILKYGRKSYENAGIFSRTTISFKYLKNLGISYTLYCCFMRYFFSKHVLNRSFKLINFIHVY